MDQCRLSLSDFYAECVDAATSAGYRVLITLIARQGDAPEVYTEIERYWSSLHDLTGEMILFLFAGADATLPDSGVVDSAHTGVCCRGDGIAVAPGHRIELGVSRDDLKRSGIYVGHDESLLHKRGIPRLKRGSTLGDDHSLHISSLKRALDLPEADLPCLHVRFLGSSVSETIPLVEGSVYAVIKTLVARLEPLFKKLDEIRSTIAALEESARRFESQQKYEHSKYLTAQVQVLGLTNDAGIPPVLREHLRRLATILESNPNDFDRGEYLTVSRMIRTFDETFWRAQRSLINRALDLWINAGTKTSTREGKWNQQAEIARRAADEHRKQLDPQWSSIFRVPAEVTRERRENKAAIDYFKSK